MTSLSGSLPKQCIHSYYCSDEECGCSIGYGNVHDNTSSLYRCMSVERAKQVEAE